MSDPHPTVTIGNTALARAAAADAAAVESSHARQEHAKALARQDAAEHAAKNTLTTTARVVRGPTSIELRNGSVVTRNHDMVTADPAHNATPGKGIVASARGQGFSASARTGAQITPDSVVDVGGMQTTVAVASKLGLIRQNANGLWEDSKGAELATGKTANGAPTGGEASAKSSQPPTDQAKAAPKIEALDATSEEIMTGFTSKARGEDLVAAVENIVAGKGFTPDLINRVSSSMGRPAEEVAAQAQSLQAAFKAQADAAAGANAEAVWTWARAHAMPELQRAIKQQTHEGSTAGYKALAQKYVETIPQHSPHLILNSRDAKAFGARREPNGMITVKINGTRTDWKTAVRAGLFKPAHD